MPSKGKGWGNRENEMTESVNHASAEKARQIPSPLATYMDTKERGEWMPQRTRLYLDVCTFCRPYDEQTSLRIRLETDAYYLILSHIEDGHYAAAISSVHFAEIADIADVLERLELEALLRRLQTPAGYSRDAVRRRADELVELGFGVADAAHVAFAETLADVLISCDDGLIKKCRKYASGLRTYNPVTFVQEENLK
jgi:predicted nucleic acid-binding protein